MPVPFRLLRVLRRGRRSVVHLAENPEGRPLAVKVFRGRSKEWDLFGILPPHEGLLAPEARGYSSEDGTWWLAFPYCPGGDLASETLSPGRVKNLLDEVSAALAALHPRWVHRDLSPYNILIDAAGRFRLADFGCLLESGKTPDIEADGLGTVSYAHPRQLLGETAAPAHDLYALGTICYECLTGVPPFSADAPERLAARKLREAPAPLPAGIPGALARRVEELLAHGREG